MGFLFDDIDRDLGGGKDDATSDFEYLNRSNRREAAKVRALIESFLLNYPKSARSELVARLRSPDSATYNGAEFELILHELLVRSADRVELPPAGPRQEKRPDFLVTWKTGEKCFVEATVASGISKAAAGANRRLEAIYEALDAVDSPDFFLSVETTGIPERPISFNALRQTAQTWVANLSYDAVMEGNEPEPFIFEEHGCLVELTVFPRGNTRGKQQGGALGIRSAEPMWVQPRVPILSAFKRKCSKYGQMNVPYIVAINALSPYAGSDDVVDALFGSRAVQLTTRTDGSRDAREVRLEDGAWRGHHGPRNRRVSAVLAVRGLGFWSLATRRMELFINPWPEQSLDSWPLDIDVFRPVDGRLAKGDGRTIGELLNISGHWPED